MAGPTQDDPARISEIVSRFQSTCAIVRSFSSLEACLSERSRPGQYETICFEHSSGPGIRASTG